MKLEIILPGDTEATVTVSGRKVIITPKFYTNGSQVAARLRIIGDGGAENRQIMRINPETGKVSVQSTEPPAQIKPKFDMMKPKQPAKPNAKPDAKPDDK